MFNQHAKTETKNFGKSHKNENKFSFNDNKFCGNDRKDDCRDDKKDDHKDKGHHKPKIWDCDDGFWGAPHHGNHGNNGGFGHHCNGNDHCTTIDVDKNFTGNKFTATLTEGVALDSTEQAMLGEVASNMDISGHSTIKGEILSESAYFNNSLGVFTINCDGTIGCVEMAVPNVDNIGATFEIDAGANADKLGFFLVVDGFNQFPYLGADLSKGDLKFVTDYGTPGAHDTKVTDDGSKVSLVYTGADNEEIVVPGPFWFTSDRDGANLNSDGMVHTISGVDPNDCNALKIAFEDLPASVSDQDYNDAVFSVKITEEVSSCNPCGPKPDCDPKPQCDGKDIVDFGDCVTKAITDFVSHTTTNAVNCITNTSSHTTTAAAVLSTISNIADDLINKHVVTS